MISTDLQWELSGMAFLNSDFDERILNFSVNPFSIVVLGGPRTNTLSTIPNPNAIWAIP